MDVPKGLKCCVVPASLRGLSRFAMTPVLRVELTLDRSQVFTVERLDWDGRKMKSFHLEVA
jgi:hypothetical protein